MSAMVYSCLTAPGVEFATKAEFTAHYKSEWHRYNLKRKTAQLPMLSEADFEARRAAAQASAPKAKEDGHVKPEKRDARKHRQEKMKKGGFRAVGAGACAEPTGTVGLGVWPCDVYNMLAVGAG